MSQVGCREGIGRNTLLGEHQEKDGKRKCLPEYKGQNLAKWNLTQYGYSPMGGWISDMYAHWLDT